MSLEQSRPNLVTRASQGDGQAFRAIFDEHSESVYRFTLDMLRSKDAADEATQETFVRAHTRLGSLRDPEKLIGWLLGIARLVAMEALRAQKKANRHDSIDDIAASPLDLSSQAPSPISLLLQNEADQVLGTALQTLESERCQALLLRVDHRLAYDEIATIMNWSLAKVKNEIHRARGQLRKRLAEGANGGDQ